MKASPISRNLSWVGGTLVWCDTLHETDSASLTRPMSSHSSCNGSLKPMNLHAAQMSLSSICLLLAFPATCWSSTRTIGLLGPTHVSLHGQYWHGESRRQKNHWNSAPWPIHVAGRLDRSSLPRSSVLQRNSRGDVVVIQCGPGDDGASDSVHMRRALELASQGVGNTRPNPAVGCVVLDKKGKVVGEGYHPKAGEPHAEIWALRQAGDRAMGGTAYVTLEPCNHFGRTPPCTSALLESGVKRVVAGMVDPDPRTAGGGLRRLAEGGVEVSVGVEGDACQELNAPFVHRI
ncbi:unnamed protein product, partial [Choristocarpus tenellus]